MSLLFESIACIDGVLQNISWHEARLNNSRKKLFSVTANLNLININIPTIAKQGLWKCRVSYSEMIEKIDFEPYTPKQPTTFKLVESNIDYSYKFVDRDEINQLLAVNSEVDDIVIVKNKLITDSSIGNLIFYDGSSWYTPNKPLLTGTMRAKLIAEKKVKEISLPASELGNYQNFMTVNALNPFDLKRVLPTSVIHW